ncbi:hypothetical protein [Phenylobacterium ferrooxidans]|uniref:Uncharacterized protein n=1 Tax=Phenylobacterium ferrooxidans TaxID=2982689 RepID=A0ABW6CM81_9CAUL
MSHRVKNLLTIATSLTAITSRSRRWRRRMYGGPVRPSPGEGRGSSGRGPGRPP